MIYAVSSIFENPKLKDYYKVVVTRQEPEVNNNKVYNQEVSGSLDSVKWFRDSIIKKMKKQNERGV